MKLKTYAFTAPFQLACALDGSVILVSNGSMMQFDNIDDACAKIKELVISHSVKLKK